ncbi:uncharacterized protein LOC111409614 [Olea europaea var. sylvestris]|uniref:uncharacterized protein LOC111409614 n=1 Tax=Olea europaea var. sylvestris TaxID=158386 RepID=UPI000C1CE232|nr:uncharacterized protein LOC111409614 [Olea europaea var. sylvestris]
MVFHVRSNSFPSKSHPEIANVEDHICSLPSVRRTLIDQANELLDGSLELVDICGIARDVILLMKESVEELESSLRRNRGIDTYMNSRKKIEKMVKKSIKNLKTFDQCSTVFLNKDSNLASMLKEAQTFGFSVLKSALTVFASKQKAWSLVSKFSRSSCVHSQTQEKLYALNIDKLRKDMDTLSVQNVIKQLKESEMILQELEENLEAFFRSLVKTRVSLLNVLNH